MKALYAPKHRRALAPACILLLMVGVMPLLGSRASAGSPSDFHAYIAVMKSQADTSAALKITDLVQRRWAIYRSVKDAADRTQSGILTYLYTQQMAGKVRRITSLYIVNAVAFESQQSVADAVASRSDVHSVSVDEVITIPNTDVPATHPDFWNIDQIRAREAWEHGYSGAGETKPVVVGAIDTGADPNHPALSRQFRGAHSTGYNADYNWFDAVALTHLPSDPNGHGTHVLGTIAGGDGPGPFAQDTGIAYGAKWISARAFDKSGKGLTSQALLASQWMQFPTRTNRESPRPDLAPDIVNNSWSTSGGCRIWWKIVVRRWIEAFMVPVFSIGDAADPLLAGPNSPGDLIESEGIGATDLGPGGSDVQAGFSPTGPAACPLNDPPSLEVVKPDVAAPGVHIRSARPGGLYGYRDGTSMAAAHTSGVLALMLDAAGMARPVTATLADLEHSAVRPWDTDANPELCDSNDQRNDLGCGRVDALSAVLRARQSGSLNGFVKNASGIGIGGARVSIVLAGTPGAVAETVLTNSSGFYTIGHLKGTYDVTIRAWGYVMLSAANGCTTCTVTIPDNTTLSRNFTLTAAARGTVMGTVRQYASGDPAGGGIRVGILEAPPCSPSECFETTTAADGTFTIANVPATSPGEIYNLYATGGRCAVDTVKAITVTAGANLIDIARDLRRDAYGYFCAEQSMPWIPGETVLDLKGDDETETFALPWAFNFYGKFYGAIRISTNGVISFAGDSPEYFNDAPPSLATPNAALYPMWDDLVVGADAKILTRATSDALTIEWHNVGFRAFPLEKATFSATLHRNGDIEYRYLSATGAVGRGSSATIGIENETGSVALVYSYNEDVIQLGRGILFSPIPNPGVIQGTIQDTSGSPVPGASAKASYAAPPLTRSAPSAGDGRYRLWLPAGSYNVEASAYHYGPETKLLTVVRGQSTGSPGADFKLTRLLGYSLSGLVKDLDTGAVIPGIPVAVNDTRVDEVRTDPSGRYEFPDILAGSYTVSVAGSGRCRVGIPESVTVSGPTTRDLRARELRDSVGYRCIDYNDDSFEWVGGDTPIAVVGDDSSVQVNLPFLFPFYDTVVSRAWVTSDGILRLDTSGTTGVNSTLPSTAGPNRSLYPFWDDLVVDVDGGAQVLTRSEAGRFVVEWRNVSRFGFAGSRLSFEVILFPDGTFTFQYRDTDPDDAGASGASATIGIEGAGTVAFQYSFEERAVRPGLRIEWSVRQTALAGRVFDVGSGSGVASAKVTATGPATLSTTTSSTGVYRLNLSAGTYTLTVAKLGYHTKQLTGVVVIDGLVNIKDVGLTAAPKRRLSGKVTDTVTGNLVPSINLSILHVDSGKGAGTITTSPNAPATGTYSIELPEGTYQIGYTGRGYCMTDRTRPPAKTITITTATELDFEFPMLRDAYGLTCREESDITLAAEFRPLSLTELESGERFAIVTLPFKFPIYGDLATTAYVSPQGYIQFDRGAAVDLPETINVAGLFGVSGVPGPRDGAVLDVFRAEGMTMDGSSDLLAGRQSPCFPQGCPGPSGGVATYLIEWRGVLLPTGERVGFEVILRSDGTFEYRYNSGGTFQTSGRTAEIGAQDPCSASHFVYYEPSMDTSSSGLGPVFKGFALNFLLAPRSSTPYTPCP